MGNDDIHDNADNEYQEYLASRGREERAAGQREYQRYLKQRGHEERREGRIQDKRELLRRIREDKQKEREERTAKKSYYKELERERKIAIKENERKRLKPTQEERIERRNKMSFIEKFKHRKDPYARQDRLAEMRLRAEEETVKSKLVSERVKQKKLKQSLNSSSIFGNNSKSKGRSSRSGGSRGFGYSTRGSIFDNSHVGSGLDTMFGNKTYSISSSGKLSKKDTGIDGLRKLFG